MRNKKNYLLITLFLAVTIFINPNSSWGESSGEKEMTFFLAPFIQSIEKDIVGLQGGAIALISKGKLLYKNVFGYARGKSELITETTLFSMASVSKPITSILIANLVQKGKINLDEPINIPFLKQEVNLKHLLSHTSGYHFSGNYMIEKGLSRNNILSKLGSLKPSYIPGESHFYSNILFSLIEEVLNLNSTSLSSVCASFNKTAGIKGIKLLDSDPKRGIAIPHKIKKNNQGIENSKRPCFPNLYTKATPSSAGFFASLNGLIEFLKIQMGNRPDIIGKDILKIFIEPLIEANAIKRWIGKIKLPLPIKEIKSFYGLGWRILKSEKHKKRDLIFHSGFLDGARTFVGYVPDLDVGLIIVINQDTQLPIQKGLEFWGECLEKGGINAK